MVYPPTSRGSGAPDTDQLVGTLFARMTLDTPDVRLEQVALSTPAWAGGLARAKTLSDAAWSSLWHTFRRDTDTAVALASRKLSARQLDQVCATKLNTKVLRALLDHNRSLTDQQLAALAAKAKTAVAKCLLDVLLSGDTPVTATNTQVAAALAVTAGPERWARLLVKHDELFSDADRLALLDAVRGADIRSRTAGRDVQLLLWRHRQLFDRCIDASRDAWLDVRLAGIPHAATVSQQAKLADLGTVGVLPERTTAAGEQLVQRRFALMSLVNNPACHPEVVAHVADVARHWRSVSQPHVAQLDDVLSQLESSCRRRLATEHKARAVTQLRSVSDAATLAWLVGRAAPDHPDSSPKPLEVLELSYNPNLSDLQAADLARALRSLDLEKLLGTTLCQERATVLAQLAGDDSGYWWSPPAQTYHPRPDRDPASLDEREQALVAAVTLDRLRSTLRYDEGGLHLMVQSGQVVQVIDWLLVQLVDRTGKDTAAFAAAASLLEHLDPDCTLSELLELAGVV